MEATEELQRLAEIAGHNHGAEGSNSDSDCSAYSLSYETTPVSPAIIFSPQYE